MLEGSLDFYINTQRYRMEPGRLLLVNSNEVHSIDSPDANNTLVLQIPRGLFEKYLPDADSLAFRQFLWEPGQGSTQGSRELRAASLIVQMHKAYVQKQPGYLFAVLGSFYELMYLLVTEFRIQEADEERIKQHRYLDRLSHITNYIQVNYREDLTLEGIARIFGYSPAYLSRMFQKYAGIHYKAYVLELRTQAGYRLLMNTEMAVGEIALECGFPDGRSFSKAFRRRYGMAPAAYRKKRKAPPGPTG